MVRNGRIAVVVAVVLLLSAPVLADRDGYPLSTYPMYARTRSADVDLVTAQGLDEAGGRHTLSLDIIGVSDDPLIVAGELRAAIGAGRADTNCTEIAARTDDPLVVAIEVVTERHDVVARTIGADSLIDRIVHARCETGAAA